jgi:type I restriction enzyme, S subunit
VNRGQIATRHDPYFYLPRFVHLEALVQTRSQAKLRDFIVTMSGGSTPRAEEQEKYYADATTGIPFVRVQNLKVSGELSLDDVKHVNHETHHGLLLRSQVKQDDLLVKITGVGRMAVAAVPPQGFEGNINQHIARIRTKDRASSEALAAWLNTDIAEALAKRRSTGGTRPALDYPALRSIPVILDERTEREVRAAYDAYKATLKEARHKLAGIDDYLLAELGIALPPEQENILASRIFTAHRRELKQRIDPARYTVKNRLLRNMVASATCNSIPLRKCLTDWLGGDWGIDVAEAEGSDLYQTCLVIRNTEFDNTYNLNIDNGRQALRAIQKSKLKRMNIRNHDLLIEKSGGSPDQPVGRVAIIETKLTAKQEVGYSNFLVKLSVNKETVLPYFLFCWLKTAHRIRLTESMQAQTNGIRNLIMQEYLDQLIPIPSKVNQMRIATEILRRMDSASRLHTEAKTELESAKRRIEAMLLGQPS